MTRVLCNQIFIIFTIFLMVSCGRDYSDEENVSFGFSEQALNGGTPLTDSKMAVALRICYAFRTKRSKFNAELIGSDFSFDLTNKDCSENEATSRLETTLRQLLIDGPLSFESSVSVTYAREVQTDINGHMKEICDQALKGETPLNIIEKDNMLYEFEFYSDVNDVVEVKVGSEVLANKELKQVQNIFQLHVLTNQLSSGDYQGVVYKNVTFSRCSENSIDFKSREQTFIPPT